MQDINDYTMDEINTALEAEQTEIETEVDLVYSALFNTVALVKDKAEYDKETKIRFIGLLCIALIELMYDEDVTLSIVDVMDVILAIRRDIEDEEG